MQLTAKILALYFILGSFFPKTDFGQLTALPDLYQHFLVHQQEASLKGQTISYLDFLQKHFLDTDSHDDERHNNLPLKSVHSTIDFYFKNITLAIPAPEIICATLPAFHREMISLNLSKNLFRPPIF